MSGRCVAGQLFICRGVGPANARAHQPVRHHWVEGRESVWGGRRGHGETVARARRRHDGTRLSCVLVGSDVITPPRVSPTKVGPGVGLDRPMTVIVLNDNHNTFEGVATILSQFVPGVDYAKAMGFAKTIHDTGRATVWRGDAERAELVWEQLKGAGLTMAPLAQG